jgi:hypothetical protein
MTGGAQAGADMNDITTALASTTAAIAAAGGLGTAAFGLVDATKAFGGGVSNCGFGHVRTALAPFSAALASTSSDWMVTIRANWINGVPKDDQKAAAKALIRLGLSAGNARAMAVPGHVDPDRLDAIIKAVEAGAPLTSQDADVLGRFNAAIDAAMDAGFELGDQQYRNSCRLVGGVFAVALALWAGYLIDRAGLSTLPDHAGYLFSSTFWAALFVGIVAVPLAPVAKDLASALQTAANAVQAVKP